MVNKSLYAQYILERTSDKILETPYGFATYRHIPGEKATYIMDIYVIPEARKSSVASQMADKIAVEAKEIGHTKLYGSVVPSAKSSTQSVQVLIAYGMTLKSAVNDFILFEKDLD